MFRQALVPNTANCVLLSLYSPLHTAGGGRFHKFRIEIYISNTAISHDLAHNYCYDMGSINYIVTFHCLGRHQVAHCYTISKFVFINKWQKLIKSAQLFCLRLDGQSVHDQRDLTQCDLLALASMCDFVIMFSVVNQHGIRCIAQAQTDTRIYRYHRYQYFRPSMIPIPSTDTDTGSDVIAARTRCGFMPMREHCAGLCCACMCCIAEDTIGVKTLVYQNQLLLLKTTYH